MIGSLTLKSETKLRHKRARTEPPLNRNIYLNPELKKKDDDENNYVTFKTKPRVMAPIAGQSTLLTKP